jgi:hypothetical protein
MPAATAPSAAPDSVPPVQTETVGAEFAWLYRSEGFAEDLDDSAGADAKTDTGVPGDSNLVRWGLPVIALFGVVGMAAAFTWV